MRRVFVLLAVVGLMLTVIPASGEPIVESAGVGAHLAQVAQVVEESPDDLDAKPLTTDIAGETGRWVAEIDAKADLSQEATIEDRDERLAAVRQSLLQTAQRTQTQVIRALEGANAPYEAFWLRNQVVFEGDQALADRISSIAGVSEVRPEVIYPLVRPVETEAAIAAAAGDPEWGVDKIGADEAWASGVTGGGIVVGNIDTGVEYTHPALVNQYRGNNGDGSFTHDHNWWDPSGICGDEPCDNVFHGTHTMGTMVGGDGPGPFTPDIGVAPGAKWIAAKGCEDLGCSESALLSSGEFMLAPTDLAGENPDPSLAPHIINNSWGSGPGDIFYQDIVTAWRAAGIFPVFSSGNPGPECGAGGSPGDFNESFSVGATDIDDLIADFSGRGPSVFGKVNPDVSAPGVDVLSAVPGEAYEIVSGTSMAAPHVAGAMALVLSASPELIGQAEETFDIVRRTAVNIVDTSCGGDADGDPNNVYGEGRIDAAAAVAVAATGGTLTGSITDVGSGTPLPGAEITAISDTFTGHGIADETGTFTLLLPEATYTVTASSFGYETAAAAGIVVTQDQTTVLDLQLEVLPTFTLSGRVFSAENGNPLRRVAVQALGTPVDPVFTNRSGRYSLTLPLGTYTIQASQGGCLEPATSEIVLDHHQGLDFQLGRKLDRFGHGCRPIGSDFDRVSTQSAVYGDDAYGRLLLPRPFTFYGEQFSELYLGTNGHLGFLDPFFSPFFNTEIPNSEDPNGAIYALWQDLIVDGSGQVLYDFGRTGAVRRATIEYRDVRPLGEDLPATFQVKVFSNDAVEIHWGAGVSSIGAGARATIGIESPGGDDALQYGFREPVAPTGGAVRFEVMANATITGVVTNANDGGPVEGALVVASPGGQNATTDADGRYSLRVIDGSYVVTASAEDYLSATESVEVGPDDEAVLDFALDAAQMEIAPEVFAVSAPLGGTASETLTVSNTGTAGLDWEIKERETAVTPPDLPPAPNVDGQAILRPLEWAPFALPEGAGVTQIPGVTFEGPLDEIIDDPDDDATSPPEITSVSAGSDGAEMSLQVDFAELPSELGGYVFLDIDQDPNTGIPAEALSGKPTQDVGMEFFVDMFTALDGVALVVDAVSFEIIAEVPVVVEGSSVRFDLPFELLGDDDGTLNVAMVLGDFFAPTDWAPDAGHGTIEPFRDAPWMSVDPVSGTTDAGGSQEVTVTFGGPDIAPGTYEGELVVRGNDPRTPQISVPVTLEVALPENFGSLTGTVTDSLTGEPVSGAALDLASDPTASTTSAEDGTYLLFGPEGDWDLEVSAGGYLPSSVTASVAAGVETTLDVVINPEVPVVTLEGDPPAFALAPDETASSSMTLGNAGFADLDFEIIEVEVPTALARPDRQRPEGVTSQTVGTSATAVTPNQGGGPVLVLMDALPWDSDALLQVLDAHTIPYDIVGSDGMGEVDFGAYQAVIVSNDQPQAFYNAYADNLTRLEEFAVRGGLVWVGAASAGFNGGSFGGTPLPGGATIVEEVFEDANDVLEPDHPAMAGVPNPFAGDAASHSTFLDLPEDALVITTGAGSGEPTMAEYRLGAGMVLGTAQTLEYAFEFGEDSGLILENLVPYVASFLPGGDAPWLTVAPVSGIVAPGESQELVASANTAGVDPGAYRAALFVITNDPSQSRLVIPVGLEVSSP